MKHARIRSRSFGMALLVAVFGGATLSAVAGPLDQPLPGYAEIIDPVGRDITAGLTSVVSVKIQSIGPAPINWVALSPNSRVTLLSASGISGWNPKSVTGNRAVFAGRQILPGGTWTFNLELSGMSTAGEIPAGDTIVPLTIEVSSDSGAHKRLFGPPPTDLGALTLSIKVLRVIQDVAISAPARAADGTATEGQDNLEVTSTVKNFGSGVLTTTATLTANNAKIPSAVVPLTLGPGEFQTVSYSAIAGSAGELAFGLDVTSISPAANAAATSDVTELQTAPLLSCTKTETSGSDSIFNPAYKVTFNKTGVPSLEVDSYTLAIKTPTAFGPAPVLDGAVAAGDVAGQLVTFPPVAVPADTVENEYDVLLDVAAVDSNGALLAVNSIACPEIRVDITAPSLTSATMAEIDSALRQVRLDPDASIAVNFSEIIDSGTNSAEDWVPLDANGERVSGVTIQGVEPCSDAPTTCRTLTVDAGFSDTWKNIKSLEYCGDEETSYADLVGNHAPCGSAITVL